MLLQNRFKVDSLQGLGLGAHALGLEACGLGLRVQKRFTTLVVTLRGRRIVRAPLEHFKGL